MAIDGKRLQRVGHVLRYRHQVGDFTGDDSGTCGSQEPAAHDKAHQALWYQLCHHRQTQTGNHQLTDTLQRVAQNQPVNGDDTGVGCKFGAQRQDEEGQRAEHHADRKFMRHWQTVAHLVIDSGQNRAADHNPERVQRLELFRLEANAQNGVLNVADSKKVQ